MYSLKLYKSINQSYKTARTGKNMDKLFLLSFLGLLLVAHGVAGNMVFDNIDMLEELENLGIEEEYEGETSPIPSWTSERGSKVLVNVDSFGAVGDGVSDDTQVNMCFFRNICISLYLNFKLRLVGKSCYDTILII